jgi:NitT/TauT family transport system substrate-binding protein
MLWTLDEEANAMNDMTDTASSRLSRRTSLANVSVLGAASVLGVSHSIAAERPPETSKIRLVHAPAICLAPQYLAEEFLRIEGFTEVEYVKNWTGYPAKSIDQHQVDFTQDTAPSLLPSVESGGAAVALAGVHVGCYELFAYERVRSVRDMKGKTVSIPSYGSPDHMLLASMLAYVGDRSKQRSKLGNRAVRG